MMGARVFFMANCEVFLWAFLIKNYSTHECLLEMR